MVRLNVSVQDAVLASRKIECLILDGAFHEAHAVLARLEEELTSPVNPFATYRRLADVPLGLSGIDLEILGALEEHEIKTHGQLERADDREVLAIPGIGKTRLRRLRREADKLAANYIGWQLKRHA